jgi:hypothetical protein
MSAVDSVRKQAVQEAEQRIVGILRGLQQLESTVVVELLSRAVSKALPSSEKSAIAQALLRGIEAREQLKKEEGGSLSADETARVLGLNSKQAVIDRYNKGRLIGWTEKQGAIRFPVWQFNEHGQTLSGLEEILAILGKGKTLDAWAKVLFFLNSRESLNHRRPLDLLRNDDVELLKGVAQRYIE